MKVTLAHVALAVALVALVAIIVHAMVPTPPAHTMDPFLLGRRDA